MLASAFRSLWLSTYVQVPQVEVHPEEMCLRGIAMETPETIILTVRNTSLLTIHVDWGSFVGPSWLEVRKPAPLVLEKLEEAKAQLTLVATKAVQRATTFYTNMCYSFRCS